MDGEAAGSRICFILSAGRTGTVSLAHALRRDLPQTIVLHEPPPARIELLLGNIRNRTGFGHQLLRTMFIGTRRARFPKPGDGNGYVEINPMLCPVTDLLPALGQPFNLVQIVRHPVEWVQSMVAFKASGRYRAIVPFIPFAELGPWPRPVGWTRMTVTDRTLWRWRYCNERIMEARTSAEKYVLVRFEDLFSPDLTVGRMTYHSILDAVPGGIVAGSGVLLPPRFERLNPRPAPDSTATVDEATARMACGTLAETFDYDLRE